MNQDRRSTITNSQLKEGYKQTEVGIIPEDWTLIDMSNLCLLKRGFDITEATRTRGDIPVYSSSGIAYFHNKALVSPPGVVTGRKGILGKVFFIKEPFWPHDTTLWVKDFRGNYPAYVAIALKNFHLERLDAATSVPTLNRNNLAGYLIPHPPIAEQEAIASTLSDIDALIESLDRLLTKKRQIKQGAMQELLRSKDGWVEKKLGKTATLKARIGWQGLTTSEYLDLGDFHLVTGTEFKNGFIDWDNCHFVEESRYKQDKNIQLKIDDILVTKDGTIGKVAIINYLKNPATLNSGVFVIRSIDNAFHSRFFYYLLCSDIFNEFLSQLSAGSTINHLYRKDFINFTYQVPKTLEEQIEIANILSDMDAEIESISAKLTKTRQLKQGMMHELLTGRIRLVSNS